jgi:hypothetical protein
MIEFGGTRHATHAQTNRQYSHQQRHAQLAAQQILFLGSHPHNINIYSDFLLLNVDYSLLYCSYYHFKVQIDIHGNRWDY